MNYNTGNNILNLLFANLKIPETHLLSNYSPFCKWSNEDLALTSILNASSVPGAVLLSGCRRTASFL